MLAAIQTVADLTCVNCWCGVPFAMPDNFYRQCRDHGKTFHCPHGHENVFREPAVKKLERELAAEKAKRDQAEARVREERERANREHSTRKRYQTRVRNLELKAVAGECPCCERKFSDLAAHMAEQHPDHKPEEESAD